MKKWQQINIALLIVCSTLSGNLTAKIYTWIDKNGKTHFSDKPINNEEVTTVNPRKSNNIGSTVAKDNQWQQNFNETKLAKAEQAKKSAKGKKAKQAVCNQLKSQIATIEQGGRFFVMSPDGERNFQSEAQLKAEMNKLTKAYKKSCR